jgi:hypothetical protein
VTAEFAVALPAVLLVLLLAIGAVMLSAQRLSLSSAAAQMARHEARGDAAAAAAVFRVCAYLTKLLQLLQ